MNRRNKGDIVIWRGGRVRLVQEKMRGWFVHDAAEATPKALFFADAGEMRDTAACDVCGNDIAAAEAQHIPGIGYMHGDGCAFRPRMAQEAALAEMAKIGQEQELLDVITRLRARAEDVRQDADNDFYYEIDSETGRALILELIEAASLLASFHKLHFLDPRKRDHNDFYDWKSDP